MTKMRTKLQYCCQPALSFFIWLLGVSYQTLSRRDTVTGPGMTQVSTWHFHWHTWRYIYEDIYSRGAEVHFPYSPAVSTCLSPLAVLPPLYLVVSHVHHWERRSRPVPPTTTSCPWQPPPACWRVVLDLPACHCWWYWEHRPTPPTCWSAVRLPWASLKVAPNIGFIGLCNYEMPFQRFLQIFEKKNHAKTIDYDNYTLCTFKFN